MEFLTTQKWEFFVKFSIKKITIIWWNFSLLKKWEISGTYSAIKVATIWWNLFHVVKVVNTTDLETTLSINFIPITIFGVAFYGPSGLTVNFCTRSLVKKLFRRVILIKKHTKLPRGPIPIRTPCRPLLPILSFTRCHPHRICKRDGG